MTSKIKVDNIADQNDNNIINESGDVITVGAAGDTVAVAGNIVKSNAYQASDGGNIVSQSGTTITLGASGDTIALSAGASQSGFGRTGTVDWQTSSIKTATFTAANGEGYFVNTTGGVVTANLPSSPSAGNIVSIADYAGTAATNNITIGRNGSNIEGSAADAEIKINRQTVTLVYVDGTQGWIPINENDSSFLKPEYVAATGGTIVTIGDYKYHKFTGPGTFCVSNAGNPAGNNNVELVIVAGGGAGGGRYGGGGGGGGMVLTPTCGIPVSSATGFPIAVGAGGAGVPQPCGGVGLPGVNSTGFSLTSIGGGGGIHTGSNPGQAGGSGGGSGQGGSVGPGTQPSQPGNSGTFGFGNNSGCGSTGAPNYGHAGGGGAGGVGGNGSPGGGGNGGNGKSVTPQFPGPAGGTTFAGGGGGGSYSGPSGGGGPGGGGGSGSPGTAGCTNSGGGGGGSSGNVQTAGGNGGSGIAIIKYKFQN